MTDTDDIRRDEPPAIESSPRAFRTQSECLAHAACCERMAADLGPGTDRELLVATARYWRTLAKHAKA